MKKAVLTLFLLLSLQSCSQKTMITQNPNITADNLVEEIAKQVKHYPSEPQYVMHYFNGVCNFEIYINDFKVVKSFNNESFKTSERINPFLLSKNNQLKIILYPRDSVNKLNQQAGLNLKVNSYENTDRFSIEKQQSNLFIYQTPEDENGFFKYAGKEYFEQTVAFTLPDVPYKIEGWKDSQDLRNFDKKLLEQKVLQAYQMIQKSFKERDLDKIAQFSYNKMKDQAIAQYFDKEEVQEGWEELISIAGADNLEFYPLENYELVFYGEGRLVGLKSKKKDKGFRGSSALLCKFKREGKWVGAELDYLLHIPKGKTEFEIY
ncbi:MAG: hypothetical protein ACFNYA_05860 [Capnocytophaga granulosa]